MMRAAGILIGLIIALADTTVNAQAPIRTALLIGNAAYSGAPLRNPANDVRAVADALKPFGFNIVTRENLKQGEMRETLRAFVLSTRTADVRLFYFAGHGLQMRGRNYLIPVDAKLNNETDILEKTADATELIEQLSVIDTGANLVIIDACRTHPVFSAGTRKMWAAKPGLAAAPPPRGTLLAFSTRPGNVARDGDGPTSIYTRHLTQVLKESPALPIEVFFKEVRARVVAETRNAQVPWESSDLSGELCFRPDANGQCKRVQ